MRHDTKDPDYIRLIRGYKWQLTRLAYLKRHPVCEICEAEGRTRQAVEVHHRRPVTSGASFVEKSTLCFNPANLQALCEECHHDIHNRARYLKRGEAYLKAKATAAAFAKEWLNMDITNTK